MARVLLNGLVMLKKYMWLLCDDTIGDYESESYTIVVTVDCKEAKGNDCSNENYADIWKRVTYSLDYAVLVGNQHCQLLWRWVEAAEWWEVKLMPPKRKHWEVQHEEGKEEQSVY